MTITRFAPSPTGRLHLGHFWSAVQAHDLARANHGRFLLRIEDIDGTRSRPEHVQAIIDDLRWLGIGWDDDIWFQSTRIPVYRAALDRLGAMGLLYPCFCTRADIAASASAPHGPEGIIYPGTCRALASAERARRLDLEPHCWRLDSAAAMAQTGPIHWEDQQIGRVAVDMGQLGDVVLARKDAPASYHLAVTIDDAAQGVTDIIRGVDLLHATHVHRLLQALLDLPTPFYRHHPLLLGADGERLAKRNGAPSIDVWREAGVDPAQLLAELRQGRFPIGITVACA
jgi:glutamyl-Q tRNA(Asp) synthetase